MHDRVLTESARTARRALITGSAGTLFLSGRGEVAAIHVLPFEADGGIGEPRMLSEADDRVTDAALQRQAVRLYVGDVRFFGRLTLLESSTAGAGIVHTVGLELDSVLVHRPTGCVIVPMDEYVRAGTGELAPARPECPHLAVYADRITRHTNRSHAEELRTATAGFAGVPVASVAAAEIRGLHEHGFTVRWIGLDGVREMPISFDRAAHSPTQLALMMRRCLTDS